ncbi:Transient receptor putative cation channel subfamily M member 2 [Cichlidogyrus casuarinus]|uniref:Transient receptor putative cation channel subfamily M member 2 n=1 Tax=Cichlidogyrus casuarinus TaxID=1844966 RepID=A0ABD2Q1U5_9PLAT
MNLAKLAECEEDGYFCTDEWSSFVPVIMLAMHIVITTVLLTNLLIAKFATTYALIHDQSIQIWSLQRYNVMREYIERSPIPPPLITLWHIFFFAFFFVQKCRGIDPFRYNSFSKIFSNTLFAFQERSYRMEKNHERQLIQWERLRALDFQRSTENPRKTNSVPEYAASRIFHGNDPSLYIPTDSLNKIETTCSKLLNHLENREPSEQQETLIQMKEKCESATGFCTHLETKRSTQSLSDQTTVSNRSDNSASTQLIPRLTMKVCPMKVHYVENMLGTFLLGYIVVPGDDIDASFELEMLPLAEFLISMRSAYSLWVETSFTLAKEGCFGYVLFFVFSKEHSNLHTEISFKQVLVSYLLCNNREKLGNSDEKSLALDIEELTRRSSIRAKEIKMDVTCSDNVEIPGKVIWVDLRIDQNIQEALKAIPEVYTL